MASQVLTNVLHLFADALQLPITASKSISPLSALSLYCLVRARRPKCIFEAGTGPGMATCVIALAIKDGSFTCDFYTCDTDIASQKHVQIISESTNVPVNFLHGTSLAAAQLLMLEYPHHNIDFFLHDSQHSDNYPQREFAAIKPKLAAKHILVYHDNLLGPSGSISVSKHVSALYATGKYDKFQLCLNRGLVALETKDWHEWQAR